MDTPCNHQYVAIPVRKAASANTAIGVAVIVAGIAVAPLGLVGCLTLSALGLLIALQPSKAEVRCARCKELA
jgi:hypothetical protein